MKKIMFLLLILNLFVIFAEEPLYISTSFESTNISPWEKQCNPTSFYVVTESPRKGQGCSKFILNAGELWTSPNTGIQTARSEIQIFGVAPAQKEIYYGWSIKIPSNYAESTDWQVIGQFHDQPDYANGETWATYPSNSPPLSLTYKMGKICLTVCPPNETSMVIGDKTITKGIWNDIILHVYWSTSTDGFVECWINDVPVTDPSGTITRYTYRNLYNQSGNYLKLGLYRSTNITTKNIVYYDEVKSGLTYESVKIN